MHGSWREVLRSRASYGTRARNENELIADQKIYQRTEANRKQVGEDWIESDNARENFHRDQVSGDGYHAGGQIETQQEQSTACTDECSAICPRPTKVPREIVNDRGFDGQHGCNEVVEAQHANQNTKNGELYNDPERADGIEPQPAHQAFSIL
jgi:hypothetical protein